MQSEGPEETVGASRSVRARGQGVGTREAAGTGCSRGQSEGEDDLFQEHHQLTSAYHQQPQDKVRFVHAHKMNCKFVIEIKHFCHCVVVNSVHCRLIEKLL